MIDRSRPVFVFYCFSCLLRPPSHIQSQIRPNRHRIGIARDRFAQNVCGIVFFVQAPSQLRNRTLIDRLFHSSSKRPKAILLARFVHHRPSFYRIYRSLLRRDESKRARKARSAQRMTPFSSSSMRTIVTSPALTISSSHCYPTPPPELSPLLDKNDDCWKNTNMEKALPVIDEEQEHASSPVERSPSRSSRRLTIRKSETFECLTDLLLPHDGEHGEHHHDEGIEAEEAQEIAQQQQQQRATIPSPRASSTMRAGDTLNSPPHLLLLLKQLLLFLQDTTSNKKNKPRRRECAPLSPRSATIIFSAKQAVEAAALAPPRLRITQARISATTSSPQAIMQQQQQHMSSTPAPTAFERSSGNSISRMPFSPRSLPAGNHY